MENNIINLILQYILILVYFIIGTRSFLVGKRIIGNTWLSTRRRDSLYMITGIATLFIIAEICMILKVEEIFIWFSFHISMAFVYRHFYETIDGDNNNRIIRRDSNCNP